MNFLASLVSWSMLTYNVISTQWEREPVPRLTPGSKGLGHKPVTSQRREPQVGSPGTSVSESRARGVPH